MTEHIIDVLKSRDLLDAVTSDGLYDALKSPIRVYCGFDPTGDSLHLGNMMAIMGLAWFQRYGHTPVALIGGATGMIGDPSGKMHERQLLDEETLKKNQIGIQKNIEAILKPTAGMPAPIFMNNYDWFKEFSFLHFLRDVGKHFRIGTMLGKDSVRARMESDEGMSFTEFSYQLLQGYDFHYLNCHHGVSLQIGGSDQWGNITAGTEYVRKVSGNSVYGLTWPLLTKSDGQKFGKSEKGAIWLSAEKLSPYEFYQYLFRTADADVISLLKRLTFIELGEIRELEHQMSDSTCPPNTAQKLLAEAITLLNHGQEGLEKALHATRGVLPGKVVSLDGDVLKELAKEIPTAELKREDVVDQKFLDAIVTAGFTASKGDVRRLIRNGGVWMNNDKVDDEQRVITANDLIDDTFVLVALGKKHKSLIRII